MHKLLSALFLSFLFISPLFAQKPIYNIKKSTANITIDGHLDEADWQSATVLSDFTQQDPVEGGTPSQRTEVKMVYGASSFFVGVMMYDSAPDSIVQTLGRRDKGTRADYIWIYIDSAHDLKTNYVFAVSAGGVQFDAIQTNDERRTFDPSWNAVWRSEVRITDEGWIAEFEIPYSMLRFAKADKQVWGINFTRGIARKSESNEWVVVPRGENGWASNFGEIHGLNGINPRRNIQVAPYALGRAQTDEAKKGITSQLDYEVGADVKIGITSNITLDATFNPDFGQVEADPAQLNLSTFETFNRERRPFFVEGASIYSFSFVGRDGNMLYTRRIGQNAPIMGATKVSGRTNNGLSFGFLGAATGDTLTLNRSFGALRARQEFGQNSYVGGMITGVYRGTEGNRRNAVAGGLDLDYRFKENTYKLNSFLSLTSVSQPDASDTDPVTGSAGAVEIQKLRGFWTWSASARYWSDKYNPNDLGQLRENDFYRVNASIGRQINDGKPFGPFRRGSVTTFVWSTWKFDGLDYRGIGAFAFSRFTFKNFMSMNINVSGSGFGGLNFRETRGAGRFKQSNNPNASYRNRSGINFRGGLNSDSRKPFRLGTNLAIGFSQPKRTSQDIGLNVNWDVNQQISLRADVSYNISNNREAWFSNQTFRVVNDSVKIWATNNDGVYGLHDFEGAESLKPILENYDTENTDGDYYIPFFGDRDTKQLNFSLRGDVTFSPKLSLQLYSQVFFAKGQYDNFRALIDADEFESFDAYPKSPDFSIHSFNSNMVLRWEYLPGSTAFVVWSQNRSANFFNSVLAPTEYDPYSATPADQFAETFDAYPTNVFLIKLSYLFLR